MKIGRKYIGIVAESWDILDEKTFYIKKKDMKYWLKGVEEF